jgi:hypothetical protein
VEQIPLPNSLLAQCNDVEVVVLAHCLVEVELAFHFAFFHHLVVVFVPDLFVQQPVSLIFLGVGAHIARILSLNASEV